MRAHARVGRPERKAMRVTALLQGAMLQEVSLDDPAAFDTALQGLHADAARECLLARTDEF